jgi:hypothetical protein
MDKQLFKFLRKSLILLVLLFVLDRGMGIWLEHIFFKQKHGDDYVTLYLMQNADADVLVMGSSRASHHYKSSMIEQQTNMSCFNGGRDEMNVIYTAATLPIVCKRHAPKVLILEMLPTDLSLSKDMDVVYQRIATVLLPFLHKYPQLSGTIALSPDHDLFKAKLLHIYPYNSTIGSSIQNAFTNFGHKTIKGYEPLSGAIDTAGYHKSLWSNYPDSTLPLSKVAIEKYQEVIQLSRENHIRLITVVSPFYFPFDFSNNSSFATIKKMMADNNFELYDFSHDTRFLNTASLFHDDIHLNDSGATIFTNEIIKIINHPR